MLFRSPQLTLTPDLSTPNTEIIAAPIVEEAAAPETVVLVDESILSETERQAVVDFAEKIDLSNSNSILQYGAAAQKNVADFSEQTLSSVRTKDLGEIGQVLSNLVTELKSFDQP